MYMPSSFAFPSEFLWGAASSSYQIEGGSSPDLRGDSVWDAMCRKPGAVHSGHHGEIACDHFNRMESDVAMMKAVGLRAYRFSVAWPRVMPDGDGKVNTAGLDFYDRLVDALLAAGIQPWATLFHWDYPTSLFHRGGWLNRDSAAWFGEYTAHVARRLGDRVHNWMTLNEPQVFVQLGHADGTHAPGIKLGLREQLTVVHNALRAHGRATKVLRDLGSSATRIGWAPVGHVSFPTTQAAADIEIARQATFMIHKKDLWNNTWFADPVVFGRYPEDGLKVYGKDVPSFPSSDMAEIAQKIDFYGVNIYTGGPVRAATVPSTLPFEGVPAAAGAPRTAFNWTVHPEALRWGPRFLFERYSLPMYVTENGMSSIDWVDLDGRVLDTNRVDYTRRYLQALHQAVSDGTDIRGYFHWSIMDNFEWAEGYKERFGMVHVDFETLKRVPKLSAYWYSGIIDSNGAGLGEPTTLSVLSEHSPLGRWARGGVESPAKSL